MTVTHEKITEILKNWGLEGEKISDIGSQLLEEKERNVFYVGEDLVIKGTDNLGALQNYITLLEVLANSHLPVVPPIETNKGRKYIEDGGMYFSVAQRVKGETINIQELYEGDYTAKAQYIGEIIGNLHQALKSCEEINCHEEDLFKTVTNWAIPKCRDLQALYGDFFREYIEVFGKLYPKLPKQIIHRDLNPGNILLAEGKLSGFIDFELSERNIRVFDPCYAATAILSTSFAEEDTEKNRKWLAIYQNIIDGYDQIAKLSQEEKSALPYVIFSIQLICMAYFSQFDPLSALSQTNHKMFRWLLENKDLLAIE